MAVISVKPAYDESGDEAEEGYSFERAWIVIVDSLNDDSYTVLNGPGLPRQGDPHVTGQAQVIGRNAERIEESLGWLVTISYGQPEQDDGGGGGNDGEDPDDPANIRPEIRITSAQGTIVKDSDFFGNPLVNAANDPLGEDEFDENEMVIRISNHTVPFASVTMDLIDAYAGMVHGNDFILQFARDDNPATFGADAFEKFLGTNLFKWRTRLTNYNFGSTTNRNFIGQGANTRWTVELEFTVRRTWLGSGLNQGLNEVTTATRNMSGGILASMSVSGYRPILDKNSVPVRRPVLLDGIGAALVKPAPPPPNPVIAPWYLVYQKYPHGNLNDLLRALNLPRTLAGYNRRT